MWNGGRFRQDQRLVRITIGALAAAASCTCAWSVLSNALSAQRISPASAHEASGYVSAETCAGCHRQIWGSYRQTGMARSFYQATMGDAVEDHTNKNTFYHQASNSYFSMLQRDGKLYQRRYQLDSAGQQINMMEKQIDFVMGSGSHARTYLNRTSRGTLIELPLGWYTEKGGYWAMNPGYDRPDHEGFQRPITYACMFCHNAYPEIPPGHDQSFAESVYLGQLPEGIDCQRCHGPGGKHTQLAKTSGTALPDIRGSIVNPARLGAQSQMEICMACHLETTSFPLPNGLQRYERGPFSYKPGEPLSAFILNFDHAPGTGRDDKFELVSAAYRLRRSACFLKSNGKLLCTTCHNPHDQPVGENATRQYTAACRQCHAGTFSKLVESGKHTRSVNCMDCHMPKRRTEDVVHATVTDHYIQRRKPAGDLLAEIAERHETARDSYRGPVTLYYPKELPHTPQNDLYLAIAQVKEKSNLSEGIMQLQAAIKWARPERAEYYLELADAKRENGDPAEALALYREAVQRNPKLVAALQKLGAALRRSGQNAEAATSLKRAASIAPDNPFTWHELGLTYRALHQLPDAIAALEKARELDPDMQEVQNNLGIILYMQGDRSQAEHAFREAIRIQPDYSDAHGNLGNLLSELGGFNEARRHFEIALRLRPSDGASRYNYAMLLGRMRHFEESQHELEAALRVDPQLLDAHELLADLLMAKGQIQLAIEHYRQALQIRPDFDRARLGLGLALAAVGDMTNAIPYLQKASASVDPQLREEAENALKHLAKHP
jgi:predicted CXXCH cytochrome family protein